MEVERRNRQKDVEYWKHRKRRRDGWLRMNRGWVAAGLGVGAVMAAAHVVVGFVAGGWFQIAMFGLAPVHLMGIPGAVLLAAYLEG